MTSYRFEDFADRAVLLDDSRFHKCNFHHCTLIYAGKSRVVLSGRLGGEVNLRFEQCAENTLAFLGSLYRDGEFRPLVVRLLSSAGIPVRPDPPMSRDARLPELR